MSSAHADLRDLQPGDIVGWLPTAVLCVPIVAVTLLPKLSIPPFAAQGIDMSLLVIFTAIGAGLFAGCMRLDAWRLALYALAIGILGFVQILRPDSFSMSSMLLLAAIHFPYVFAVMRGNGDQQRVIARFLGIATFLAWCGIAQYFLQFVVDPRWLFPIENFVPSSYVVQHFNSQGVVNFGSDVYRANGVFLLEPSFFSQLLGVAVVVELCTQSRLSRLATYGLALLVSSAGTGLLILAVCVPLFVVQRRRWDLLLLGAAGLAIVSVFRDSFFVHHLLARSGEFSAIESSGFARFVGGFYLFDQFLWDDPWRTLFGFGVGSFRDYASRAHYPVAEMALFKLVFEFGLVGSLIYFGFLVYCLATSSAPRLVTIAVGIAYLLNGIYTPFAHGLALGLLVWNSLPEGYIARPFMSALVPARAAS
jgi:hypothetical protein